LNEDRLMRSTNQSENMCFWHLSRRDSSSSSDRDKVPMEKKSPYSGRTDKISGLSDDADDFSHRKFEDSLKYVWFFKQKKKLRGNVKFNITRLCEDRLKPESMMRDK